MDIATQRQLVKRVLNHVAGRTSDIAPVETRMPTTSYLDGARFRAELTDVVSRWPLLVAHSSQLGEPGDFVTDEIHGVPVVVVRRTDGSVGAYRNVCRHRGARLVEEPAGSKLAAFSCPYHAWRYDLDGTLSQVPEQDLCFPGIRMQERSLFPLTVWESHGLVWLTTVGPESAAATPENFVGGLAEDFAAYGFADDTIQGTADLSGAFNWKLGVEAFLEVYHFRALHPDMKNYVFSPEVACFDDFGNHLRLVAPKRNIRELAGEPEENWTLRPYATVVYYLFPATFLFVEKKHASSLQIRPTAPDRSAVRIIHFARQDGLRRPATLQRNIELFMKAVDEDLHACESIQSGLVSTPQDFLFGRNEVGLLQFRTALETALNGAEGKRR